MIRPPDLDADRCAPAMVLVGPGRHFGKALVNRFLAEGFSVGVLSGREQTLDALRDELPAGASVRFARTDVTEPEEFQRTLRDMVQGLGRLECIIYNAKVSVKAGGLSTDLGELTRSLRVNVTGALAAIQSATVLMEHSHRPSIILTGGGYKDRPHPEKFALHVGKSGLHAVAKGLVDPLRLRGIKLQTVIIKGAIRQSDHSAAMATGSSDELADFFWQIFQDQDRHVYRFPPRLVAAPHPQLF
jgi:NAD(P)-dependent dehydrogenase (short-subunit alcohol dehydrogenase family)